jgi:hypothetical protein
VDAWVNRRLVRVWPRLAVVGRRARAATVAWARRAWRLVRPLAVATLRLLGRVERVLLRVWALARRAARWAWAQVTLQRVACVVILAAAACLAVSQFVDYRAVQIGGSAYAGLPGPTAPTVAVRTAGEAHSYLLLPVALLAAALALAVLRNRRRRLGRIVFALGLLSLAVILFVDLPAGLDAGAQTSRFSAATAVLLGGFYAELAAAAALTLGGLLLFNAHRIPIRHGPGPTEDTARRRFAAACTMPGRAEHESAHSQGSQAA